MKKLQIKKPYFLILIIFLLIATPMGGVLANDSVDIDSLSDEFEQRITEMQTIFPEVEEITDVNLNKINEKIESGILIDAANPEKKPVKIYEKNIGDDIYKLSVFPDRSSSLASLTGGTQTTGNGWSTWTNRIARFTMVYSQTNIVVLSQKVTYTSYVQSGIDVITSRSIYQTMSCIKIHWDGFRSTSTSSLKAYSNLEADTVFVDGGIFQPYTIQFNIKNNIPAVSYWASGASY